MVLSIGQSTRTRPGVDGLTRAVAELEKNLARTSKCHPQAPKGSATTVSPLLLPMHQHLAEALAARGWNPSQGPVTAARITNHLHRHARSMRDLLLHGTVDGAHLELKRRSIPAETALTDTLRATYRAGLWLDLGPLMDKWASYITPDTIESPILEGREAAESRHGFDQIEAVLDRFLQDPSTVEKKDIGHLLTIVARSRPVLEGALRRKAEAVLNIAQRIVDYHPPWVHVALRQDTIVGLHAPFGRLSAPHLGKQIWFGVTHSNGFQGTDVTKFLSNAVHDGTIGDGTTASMRAQAVEALTEALPPYIGSQRLHETVDTAASEARIANKLRAMRKAGLSGSTRPQNETGAFEATLNQLAQALVHQLEA